MDEQMDTWMNKLIEHITKHYSSIKKKSSTDTQNMNETQKQCAEWKKPDTKYILYDFVNMKL